MIERIIYLYFKKFQMIKKNKNVFSYALGLRGIGDDGW